MEIIRLKKIELKYLKRIGRKNSNRKFDDDKIFLSDKLCVFCGRKYYKGSVNCVVWGYVCGACGKKNYFTF